jgi:hypothetical protein
VLQAARAKICQLLGLIAVTAASIRRAQGEAEVLQEHLHHVESWRDLLVLVCQLTGAEQRLQESLGMLQAVEQPPGQELPAWQHCCDNDDVAVAMTDMVTVTRSCPAGAAEHAVALAAGQHGLVDVDHSTRGPDSLMTALVAVPDGAALQVLRPKMCHLLQQLADKQSELCLVQCHVDRLAAVLMAGSTGREVAELQQQLQRQLQQVNRSRAGIQQQLAQIAGQRLSMGEVWGMTPGQEAVGPAELPE